MCDLPDEIAAHYERRKHHILNELFPRRGTLGLGEFLLAANHFETGIETPLNFQDPAHGGRWVFIVDTLELLDGLAEGSQPIDLVHLSDAQRAQIVSDHASGPDQGLDRFLVALKVPAGAGIYHANDGHLFVLSIDLLIAFMARVEHDAAHRLVAISLRNDEPAALAVAAPTPEKRSGLPTKDIAEIFQCSARSRAAWGKGVPDYLVAARVALGAPGGASALWCPVAVAMAMHGRKMLGIEELHRRFSNPALSPWRDQWDAFYEVFSDADRS